MVGYDDLPYAKLTTPKLTTVRQPLQNAGIRAAQLIHEFLLGKKHQAQVPADLGLLIPELIDRESVTCNKRTGKDSLLEGSDTLSSLEVECLHWTAVGKTSSEIAVILSISESTTNFHIKNTVFKLKASNRTHEVANAVSRALISLLA